jgi:hypothetical protein
MTCRSEPVLVSAAIRTALDHLEWCAQQWEVQGTPARWAMLEAARADVEHTIADALAQRAVAPLTLTTGGQWR